MLHQVSVPFAGRDICTKALKARPSFIKFLFTPQLTSNQIEDEGKLRQDPCFDDWLDNCLRIDSQELLTERMPIYRAEHNKQLLGFVSLMAVGFGGIYHYLGTILKALAKEDRLVKKAVMPVYLGGNGARFLHWLDESGAYGKGCEADLLFEALQRKSMCLAPLQRGSASTLLSSAPGDEIACGVLSKGVELKGNDDPRLDPRIAGAECTINHQAYGILDRISVDQEPGVIHQLVLKDLSELKRYVHNYDEAIGELRIRTLLPMKELVDLENSFGFWDEVEVQARSLCLEKLDNTTTTLALEPPFIICLRALQTTLVRAWAEHY